MGNINELENLSEEFSHLAFNCEFSDVTFVAEGEKFPAHRAILAGRSQYFRALLFGGMVESKQIEVVLRVPAKPLKLLLLYMYTGKMNIVSLSEEELNDVLSLAHQYGFCVLESSIEQYLMKKITLRSVFSIFQTAELYNFQNLMSACTDFMDKNAEKMLVQDNFKTISESCLQSILKRDTFSACEINIFFAVKKWFENQRYTDFKSIISDIRLSLIGTNDLLKKVRTTGMVDTDILLNAIEDRNDGRLRHRGVSKLEVVLPYSFDDEELIVDLEQVCVINCLKFELVEKTSYSVEVSVDDHYWDCLADYRCYACSSWQYLLFPSRPVRYIRFLDCGIFDTKIFNEKTIVPIHTAHLAKLHSGAIIEPIVNIASHRMGAIMVKGDDELIEHGSAQRESPGTSDFIIVRFSQPFYITSVRFHLAAPYLGTIEIDTSVDCHIWQSAIDEEEIEEDSLSHHFTFSPRVALYIRFDASDVFSCARIECPSQEPNYLQEKIKKFQRESTYSLYIEQSSKKLFPFKD